MEVCNASLADINALVLLEQQCFSTDLLTSRQWRYMLTKANASVLVCRAADQKVVGYVLILYNNNTAVARLYSIAVTMAARRLGIGKQLLKAAERTARERGRAYLRLEIRLDNIASLRLFESLGYKHFGHYDAYYEDRMDAARYEKLLVRELDPNVTKVPFYEQTLDFTCGSSALMMAMRALDPNMPIGRPLELRIWREATTIFMTSGHGGCGPFGLALAAHRRGFRTELYVNDAGVPLIDSVRSAEKKAVMRLVHEEMLREVQEVDLPVQYTNISLEHLREKCEHGAIPLVLISLFRIYGGKYPHWVVVTGFDDHFVYAHNPFVARKEGETELDSINVPIPKKEFTRMARYGRAGLQAVVLVSTGPKLEMWGTHPHPHPPYASKPQALHG